MRYHEMAAYISAFLCRMAVADLSSLGTGFMVLIPSPGLRIAGAPERSSLAVRQAHGTP
jgi:hypothetical protein